MNNIDTCQSSTFRFKRGETYDLITFGGCGYLLAFHFGVVKCLQENGILFKRSLGVSAGSMAALAILDGANLDIGIRQAIVDLPSEPCNFFNFFFMDIYRIYMSVFLKEGAHKLSGRFSLSFRSGLLKEKIITNFDNDAEIVEGSILSGTIPWATSLIPRWFKGEVVWDAGQTENSEVGVFVSPGLVEASNADVNIRGPFGYGSLLQMFSLNFRKQAFCSGYRTCQKLIDNPIERNDPEAFLEDILHETKEWKANVKAYPSIFKRLIWCVMGYSYLLVVLWSILFVLLPLF